MSFETRTVVEDISLYFHTFLPKKTWVLGWVGTPKSQEISTQTRPKSPKPNPKITETLTQKSQKPENFFQKNTRKFQFLDWNFLGFGCPNPTQNPRFFG